MSQKSSAPAIRLRGVRHNNLKNFDLDLPFNQLIVITGLSGSGKSSLAFDTLFAEGQRRYIETFSPYARQFFDRMDKPQVDSIEGIPPAIAIEQRNTVKTTRSTVGTMTEICDYMKLLWPRLARLHCRQCGQPVRKDSPQLVWEALEKMVNEGGGEFVSVEGNRRDSVRRLTEGVLRESAKPFGPAAEVLVTFDLPLAEKLSIEDSLELINRQGYQRLLWRGEVARLEEAGPMLKRAKPASLTIVQDRLRVIEENRARFVEACEQAYHFGRGLLSVYPLATMAPLRFSNRYHCAACDIEYREPSQALFSFNHPLGACPACRGFGRIITIDYDLAIPDRSKTLAGGAVKPWQTGQGAECQADLAKFCRLRGAPMDVPFEKLSKKWQEWVVQGDPDYGKDSKHEWPHAWYGVKGYFRWLESKAYKMHVRVLLSRYRAYRTCPDCKGMRFQPESLLYKVRAGDDFSDFESAKLFSLAEFYQLPLRDSLRFIESLAARHRGKATEPLALALGEVRARLGYLAEVGLGYLTLDRPTKTLSGGETERVNLTTCLGTGLVNTLYVLDEPSVGLHPRDTGRLVNILERLRDAGNTVVVVEHEASVMRAADQIVDLGPGHGETGGEVVFQGSFKKILDSEKSLTGRYLAGTKKIEIPARRPVKQDDDAARLSLEQATRHNIEDLSVAIPLGRFVCVTGVSGSGKTTLVRELLLPSLNHALKQQEARGGDDDESGDDEAADAVSANGAVLRGFESLGRAVLVDQSPLGRTPRSNPAVYIGAFDQIRELFAQTEEAKKRGLNASAFSFNSAQGQCERCRGAGFEKIEMQFLSDVFIRCPDCNGRRYRPHILEVTASGAEGGGKRWSIADVLEATVEEVIGFLGGFGESRQARRAIESLNLLEEVGLGYLRLGQPINTLSGGESQRLKLVSHLAEFARASAADTKPTLFLFDEPTTGLHFEDIRVLVGVFQRLVDAGHSVVVIEHNLDLIKSADWLIDLGPDAGDEGGRIVAEGTPEQVAAIKESHTGSALAGVLQV